MNEKQFFDLTEGFRSEHIAEAAAWKYRPHKDENEQNEIAEIFSREMQKKYEDAAPEAPFKPISAPASKKMPLQNPKPQPRIAKGFAVGLTAVAAVICAAVGIVAYHAQKPEDVTVSDNMQTPAASITNAISEQTGTAPADFAIFTDDTVTSTEQSEQSAENAEETQTAPEEFTGENYLGGQGYLHPIDKYTFEDDAYWYLYSMKTRIPKTAPDGDGIYHNELICQKAGCSHEYNNCPIAQYYNRLISDGEKIYYTRGNTIYTITDQSAGANGTMPEFFKLTNDSAGNAIYDLYPGCEMHFYQLTKLGDTGKWFVYVYFDYGSERVQYPVIFTPNTDQPFYDGTPLFLDVEKMGWEPMYDASTGMLWFGRWDDQTFVGFDINTGEKNEVTVLEDHYVTSEFYAADGKLYGMANLAQSATSFNSQTDFISIDAATGEMTVLEEATNIKNIYFIDGKLYALRSRRVQADTIVRCAPDGSNEEVLYEHNGKITNISVLRDGFIYVSQDSGNYLMVDGVFLRVELDML
jgi:hypothetical protein